MASSRDFSGVTATAATSAFRGTATGLTADLHRDPTTYPGTPYTEHGTAFVPAPGVQTASYTGASAGGAPGAQFGPPGVGGAPVDNGSLSIPPLEIVLGLALVGFLAWRILR